MKPLEENILDLMEGIFAPWFKGHTWGVWRVLIATIFQLYDRIDDAGFAIYKAATGRDALPTDPIRQAWLCIGRRGGKSLMTAFIAVVLTLRDYSQYLAPGEQATFILHAADKRQAHVLMRYVRGFINEIPALQSMVTRETHEIFEFSNRNTIEIRTASWKTGARGYTLYGAANDEVCFWESDDTAAEPDREILSSQEPAMITIPSALQLNISSPHSRRGSMWEAREAYFGKDVPGVIYWQAPSKSLPEWREPGAPIIDMNCGLFTQRVREAWNADPSAALANFGAEFRTDLERLFAAAAIEACTCAGRIELPACEGIRYFGFVDPSGGSSDAMTLGIAHRDSQGRAVLDCLRERKPPFSPDDVVREFSATLKSYRIARVVGDRYAGEWPRERFRVHGIEYVPSEKTKSQLYVEALPLVNAGSCELLDNPRLHAQLAGLERRTTRGGGRDSVDHPPNAHDDVANAAAGALVGAAVVPRSPICGVLIDGKMTWSDRPREENLDDPFADTGFRPSRESRGPSFGRR